MPIQLPPYIEDELRRIAYEREKMLRQFMQPVSRLERELLARAGIAPYAKTISHEEWAKAKLDAKEAQEIDLRAYQRQRSQQASEAGRIGGKRKAMSYVDRDEWIFSQYQALSPKRNDWANVIHKRMGRDTYWKPITTRRITQIVTRMKKSEI